MPEAVPINELIPYMLQASGETNYSLSKKIGRAPNYIATVLFQGNVPKLSTMLLISKACGYQLALLSDEAPAPEGAIIIAPDESE